MTLKHDTIIQRIIDTCTIVIKLGCLVPIALGILFFIIMAIVGQFVELDDIGYVPEVSLHYKIKRNSYTTLDDRTIYQARLYFSRTDSFDTDYIDFNYSEVVYPKIYYVKPDTFYIVDEDRLIQDISSKELNIIYLNHDNELIKGIESISEYEERLKRQKREDSILRAKSYSFQLSGYTNYVTIFDPQGEIIYKKNFKLF